MDESESDIKLLEEETNLLLQFVRPKTHEKRRSKKESTLGKLPKKQTKKSDEFETPAKTRKITEVQSEKSFLKKTLDLYGQPPPRRTVEVLDDAPPDLTPRQGYANKKESVSDGKVRYQDLEQNVRDMSFFAEKSRVLSFDDTFVPAPGVTSEDISNERNRLNSIEESARKLHKELDDEISLRREYLLHDKCAIKIQKTFRGFLGKAKFSLEKKLKDLLDNDYTNDWIEVRDRDSGDIWFYNQRTGVSQWERPDAMYSTLASKSTLKKISKESAESKGKRPATAGFTESKYIGQKTKMALKSAEMKGTVTNEYSLPQMDRTINKTRKLLRTQSFESKAHLDKNHEREYQAKLDIEKELGVEGALTVETLTGPDGLFKANLRTTIKDALVGTRFDSVTSVLGDERWLESMKDPFNKSKPRPLTTESRVDRNRKSMVSMMLETSARRADRGKSFKVAKENENDIKKLTINHVDHPGFSTSEDTETELDADDSDMDKVQPIEMTNSGMCFGCWSAGFKRPCALHENGEKVRPSQSMLLCRNWDLAVMRRRYRSEEIQEIFMKKSSSIRYDTKRKKFSTVEEQRHVVYRLVKFMVEKLNLKANLISRARRWLNSVVEAVRCGQTHSTKQRVMDQAAMMRLRRSLMNHATVTLYSRDSRHLNPVPPTTGSSFPELSGQVQYLYTIPDHATGHSIEIILAYPTPVPKKLFEMRIYHLPAPRSIPMPKPQYVKDKGDVLPSNVFMDDMKPGAWIERLASSTCRDCVKSAIEQVRGVTPTKPTQYLQRTKEPPASTIKFATLGRKPVPGMIALGGLPAELLIYQLLSVFFPPQFGSLMVMDKSIISPGFSPEVMVIFESILTPPVKQVYVLRTVEHPLNYRRPPSIVINSTLIDEDKHFYGPNRPEQTGEQESHGFRTSAWAPILLIYEEITPQAFIPSTSIATLNHPTTNHPETTHADAAYPFCEPSTRDNSSLDFYHLLLEGIVTGPKSQVFSALSIQESGFFLKNCDDSLPMGHLMVSVYRSWAFTQKDLIEEFQTDDGISYWYHRRTGQTFWERPLYEDEEPSVLDGGARLDLEHAEEPTLFSAGSPETTRRYNQGEQRTLMLVHHETDKEAKRRRETTASAARIARARGVFPDPNANVETTSVVDKVKIQDHMDFEPSVTATQTGLGDSTVAGLTVPETVQGTTASAPSNLTGVYPFGWPHATAGTVQQTVNTIGQVVPEELGGPKPPRRMINEPIGQNKLNDLMQGTNAGQGVPPATNSLDGSMVAGISQTINAMLGKMTNDTNADEMIQLGLGMGMAMIQAAAIPGIIDNVVNPPPKPAEVVPTVYEENFFPSMAEDSVSKLASGASHSEGSHTSWKKGDPEPIGLPHATRVYSEAKGLNHREENKQKNDLEKRLDSTLTAEENARSIVLQPKPTLTPDVAPPKALTVELPKNAEDGMKAKVPVYVYPELSTMLPGGVPPSECTLHPPAGVDISYVLEKDGEAQKMVPNSDNKLRRIVMPLPIGFFNSIVTKHVAKQEADYLPVVPNLPFTRSVGRVKPRSVAVDWLSINFDPWSAGKNPLGVEYVGNLLSKADKLFKDGNLQELDKLRQATVADAFATVDDLEGIAKEKAEISKAQILSKDFKTACTLCRHSKFTELEELLNQPEWNVPIDYQDEQGNSLMHVAAQNGNKRLVKLCLRRGASINLQNLRGQTALHYAYGYGYSEVGDYMVRKGADDTIRNKDGLMCYEGLGARELALL